MNQDFQFFANLACIASFAVIGYLYKNIVTSHKEIARDVSDIKVILPTSYVHKNDLTKQLDNIEKALDRICIRVNEISKK